MFHGGFIHPPWRGHNELYRNLRLWMQVPSGLVSAPNSEKKIDRRKPDNFNAEHSRRKLVGKIDKKKCMKTMSSLVLYRRVISMRPLDAERVSGKPLLPRRMQMPQSFRSPNHWNTCRRSWRGRDATSFGIMTTICSRGVLRATWQSCSRWIDCSVLVKLSQPDSYICHESVRMRGERSWRILIMSRE